MRSSKSRSRSKQNRPRTLGNIVNRVFESSGPEGKVRGTPQQIIEKYQQLARDGQLSNDRVAAENFSQHAEHYTRMLAEAMREMAAEQETRQQNQQTHQNGNGQRTEYRTGEGDQPEASYGAATGFAVVDEDDSSLVELPERQPREQNIPRRDENRRDQPRRDYNQNQNRRDERPRDERPREDRPREENRRDDRPRDDRPREENRRDDRPREERPTEDTRREDPARNENRREHRAPRPERPRPETPRFEAPAEPVSTPRFESPAALVAQVEQAAAPAKAPRAPRAPKPVDTGEAAPKPRTPRAKKPLPAEPDTAE